MQCDRKCCVKDYKQCPNCFYVMKMVCSKKGCRQDGTKPTMTLLNNASMSKGKQRAVKKKCTIVPDSSSESESEYSDESDRKSDGSVNDDMEQSGSGNSNGWRFT